MKNTPESCIELLKEFQKKEVLIGEKLHFSGVTGKDVYNISKPFLIGNELVIAGRVEKREACADSQIMFFNDEKGTWTPVYGAPTLRLEDGFATQIGNETIFGGVEIYRKPTAIDSQRIDYRTVFYRGRNIFSLKKFAVGPNNMKDIRLVPLINGHIGVFTRPQGKNNKKGRIGYLEIKSLEDINPKNLLCAKIIENQFFPGEWGGVNDPFLVKKDKILVYGHIAYEDEAGAKHYYAMSFKYDTKKHIASPIKIIATRKNFPEGSAKTPKHEDIVFLSGLVCHNNSTATIYAGLSDAEAGKRTHSLMEEDQD